MRMVVSKTIATDSDGNPIIYAEIFGLAADTKPTAGLCTGSKFIEVDTGLQYLFAEDVAVWTVQNSGNGKTSITGATVTLGSSITYDGTEKTKSVSSVKIGATTLTEDTDYTVQDNKATAVGDYTLHIVGKGSYTGIIAEAWSIGQGSGSVTASPDTLSLTDTAGTSTLTVVGDGAVTAESSDEEVCTVAISGTTLTVTPVGVGSATVTVTLAATGNYTGGTDTIAVTVSAPEDDDT